MAFTSDELDRLADDVYKARRITGSIYCGRCGYNLRTLPYVYTCPECGNEYNARPLAMKGIFFPHDIRLPFGPLVVAILSAAAAAILVVGGLNPRQNGHLLLGAAFAFISLALLLQAYRQIVRYLNTRALARRIAAEESD